MNGRPLDVYFTIVVDVGTRVGSAGSEESYYYIKLLEFILNEKEINLTIYCEPQISEDISLLLSFWIHTINSIGEFLENPNYEFKIFAKNTSNIYTLNMNKLNFGRFTEISNLNLLKIDYTNITNYYIYTNSPQTQLSIVNGIQNNNKEIIQIQYIIYITDIIYKNNQLNLLTYCEPKPSENITLLITFLIERYNVINNIFEEDVAKIVINNTTNKFQSILENLNLNDITYISKTKADIELKENLNLYYIHFPNESL